jgi:hypothetical protein
MENVAAWYILENLSIVLINKIDLFIKHSVQYVIGGVLIFIGQFKNLKYIAYMQIKMETMLLKL